MTKIFQKILLGIFRLAGEHFQTFTNLLLLSIHEAISHTQLYSGILAPASSINHHDNRGPYIQKWKTVNTVDLNKWDTYSSNLIS